MTGFFMKFLFAARLWRGVFARRTGVFQDVAKFKRIRWRAQRRIALAELMQRHGVHGMRQRISATALYGDLTRGSRVIGKPSRAAMRQILREIRGGKFAREWMRENAAGLRRMKKSQRASAENSVEKTWAKVKPLAQY